MYIWYQLALAPEIFLPRSPIVRRFAVRCVGYKFCVRIVSVCQRRPTICVEATAWLRENPRDCSPVRATHGQANRPLMELTSPTCCKCAFQMQMKHSKASELLQSHSHSSRSRPNTSLNFFSISVISHSVQCVITKLSPGHGSFGSLPQLHHIYLLIYSSTVCLYGLLSLFSVYMITSHTTKRYHTPLQDIRIKIEKRPIDILINYGKLDWVKNNIPFYLPFFLLLAHVILNQPSIVQ